MREPHAFAAICRTLVVVASNNSGSTVLRNAIAASSGCWHLEREAQHIDGFVGPSTRGTGARLIWAATPDRLAPFTDTSRYDWVRNWAAWADNAGAENDASEWIVLSSPPFLFQCEALADALPHARFVFLTRNPVAVAAGILKRRDQQCVQGAEDVLDLAAAHVVACTRRQRDNIARLAGRGLAVTYEALCSEPDSFAAALRTLCPSLPVGDLEAAVPVKGMYDEPLRNMNEDQIATLSASDFDRLSAAFARHADLFESFGYSVAAP